MLLFLLLLFLRVLCVKSFLSFIPRIPADVGAKRRPAPLMGGTGLF